MTDRTTRVSLELVTTVWQREMAKANASLSTFIKNAGGLDVVGQKMQRIGVGMSVGLTAPLAMFAKQAVETATRTGEAMNRSRVVFGQHADEVQEWAEDSARSMGLARHEAVGTAATFSNMFSEMGVNSDTARQMSMEFVQLAADVGSFRDVDPSQMLEKMRAGAVGEYEPLRQLGIVLTDATVRHKALEMGLAASTTEVSTAALVQARYALILEKTSKDQGDFARTSKDAANAQRIAAASYENAMGELGENLLPLVTKGALAVADLAEAFSSLPESAQTVILAFGGVAAVAGPMLLALGSVIRNLQTIRAVGPGAARAIGLIGKGGAIAAVLFGVVQVVEQIAESSLGAAPSIDKLGLALLEFNQRGAITGELARVVGDDFESLAKKIELAGNSPFSIFDSAGMREVKEANRDVDALDKALTDLARSGAPGAKVAADVFAEIKRNAVAAGVPVELVERRFNDYTDALAAAASQGRLTGGGMVDLGQDAGQAESALDKLNDALDEVYEKAFAAETASDGFNRTLIEFADRVRAAQIEGDGLATSMSDMTLQGLENRASIRDLAAGIIDYAGTAGASAAVTAQMREQLIYVFEQLGFNRGEVGRYIDVLLQASGITVHNVVEVDTSAARAKLMEIIGLFGAISQESERAFIQSGKKMGPNGGTWPKAAKPPAPKYVPPPGLDTVLRGGGPSATQAREAARNSGKSAADDAKRDAEKRERDAKERLERQREIEDNQYELGLISYGDYVKKLDARRKAEEKAGNKHTAEWKAIHDRRAEVVREHNDKLGDLATKQRQIEDMQYEEGRITTTAYIALLRQRHAAMVKLHGYWSDEANEIRDRVRAVQDELKGLADKELDRLNGLLDEQKQVRAQLAQAAEQHRKRMADIQKQAVDDEKAALAERRTQLTSAMRLDEQMAVTWGNTMSATIANGLSQNTLFAEWSSLLDQMRGRGMSSAVIEMLGLDEGPQALGQLRAFASATDAEIASLNALVEARAKAAGERVAAEQAQTFSKLSATLRGITERYAAEVEEATEEFLAEQRKLNEELAAIGLDGGRSFAQAIAEGMMSALPAIREAARLAQEAQREAMAGGVTYSTQPVGHAPVMDPRTNRPAVYGKNGEAAIGAGQLASTPGVTFVGGKAYYQGQPLASANQPGVGTVYYVPGKNIIPGLPGYATGIASVPNDMAANIHRGERIVDAVSNMKLVAAVQSMAGGSSQPIINASFQAILEIDGQQIPVNVKAVREIATDVNRGTGAKRDVML